MLSQPILKRLKESVRRDGPWVLLFTLLLAPFLLIVLIKNPDDEKRLNMLRQLAAETPVPPLFIKLDSSQMVRSDRASFTIYYRSIESYSEVKDFYTKELSVKGWSQPKEERYEKLPDGEGAELFFHKGEYSISVEYESEGDWNFAVGYGWWRP